MKLKTLVWFVLSNAIFISSSFSAVYPSDHLREHRSKGSLNEVIDKVKEDDSTAVDVFIQRSILTLDHVEMRGLKYKDYLSSYESQAKPLLESLLKSEKDSTRLALFESFLHRLKVYKSRDVALIITRGRSAGSTPSKVNTNSCNNLSGPVRSYCEKGASYAYITTKVNGGGSTHHETIDLFLRSLNFSDYESEGDILKAVFLTDVPPSEIDKFLTDYNLFDRDSEFRNNYDVLRSTIIENPKYYLKKNMKGIDEFEKNEILRDFENISNKSMQQMR